MRIRLLFDHWLTKMGALSRIGSFGTPSEVWELSPNLQGVIGSIDINEASPDLFPYEVNALTGFRIPVEIPYAFCRVRDDADLPEELEGERDLSL